MPPSFFLLFTCAFVVVQTQQLITVDWTTGRDVELCRFSGPRCKTVSFALMGITSGSQIVIMSGYQSIGNTTLVDGVSNVTIIGQSDTIVHCNNTAGIEFQRVNDVEIENVVFDRCGIPFNTTAIHFALSSNIFLYSVLFRNSTGSAIVFFNTIGNVSIVNCSFVESEFESVRVIFDGVQKQPSWYAIENSLFDGNKSVSSTEIQNDRLQGGGLYIKLSGTISNKQFVIQFCNFTRNVAFSGGAIYVDLDYMVTNNSFLLKNSYLLENTAQNEGGSLKLVILGMNVVENRFIFRDLHFIGNKASMGGGVMIKSVATLNRQNNITFDNCVWRNNTANYAGAAIILYPVFFPEEEDDFFVGRYPIVVLNNAAFYENVIYHTTNSQLGLGTIYSDKMSLNISGNVIFEDNYGSSIYISSAHVNILEDAQVVFSNNTALNGGGLALMFGSRVMLHKNTSVYFYNNRALELGGAIFYDLRNYMDYFHLKHCFLRYYNSSMHPNEWKAVVNFSSNTADGYGQGIYAASLKPCKDVYNATTLLDLKPFRSLNVCEVSTDPSSMKLNNNGSSLLIYPGLQTILPIFTVDELDQSMTPILLATCGNNGLKNCPYKVAQKNLYITNYNVSFNIPNSSTTSFLLRLSTLNTRQIQITVNISIQECPVGYAKVNGQCQCTSTKLSGVVSCNNSVSRTVMRVGYWAGCRQSGNTSTIITADCPSGYCSYQNQSDGLYLIESDCLQLDRMSCANNRKGRLCGDCLDNYSVNLHSTNFVCSKCTHFEYGIVFFILSELLPVTILFCFIIFFDVSLTSGPLSSFVFYAQVLDIFHVYQYLDYVPKTINQLSVVYRFLFGIFNFAFLQFDGASFCIIKGAHALDILVLKYATTLYALCLICMLFVIMRYSSCHRLIGKFRKSNKGYTVMNGIVGFIVITYSQCAKVSFQILGKQTLHSFDGNDIAVVKLAGEINYLDWTHLKYAIPAFIMIVYLVAVPTVLISYPLYFYCKKILPIREQSCQRFESSKMNLYLMPIMDAFQSSYKEDARVFAGLLFLYRLIISVSFALPPNILSGYSSLELVLVFILSLRTIFLPHRSRVDNIVESLMFADLAIINAITVFNIAYHESNYSIKSTFEILACVQFVLIIIPVIVAVIFVMLKLLNFSREKIHGYTPLVNFSINEGNVFGDNENTLPANEPPTFSDFDVDQLPARMIEEDTRMKEGTWTLVS